MPATGGIFQDRRSEIKAFYPARFSFALMAGLCCNVLFGYRSQNAGKLVLVLPHVVSISFLLIADIDAPRHGLIYVSPQNLESLAASLGR